MYWDTRSLDQRLNLWYDLPIVNAWFSSPLMHLTRTRLSKCVRWEW
jgi:hypothetical protein